MAIRCRAIWVLVGIGLVLGGCGGAYDEADEGAEDVETAEQMIQSTNGLDSLNGIDSLNGLDSLNGFNPAYGISLTTGLANGVGLMASAAGRKTVEYLVKCALGPTQSITKQDECNTSYTFQGSLGVATSWATGTCGTSCQEAVSACVVAHINTAGLHVPIWLVGDSQQPNLASIGVSLSPSFPHQEGSFFGNVFQSPPKMFYCHGKDFGVNQVPGRIGAGGTLPSTDPFTANNGYCAQNCTPFDTPNQSAGYKACYNYNQVLTVYLQ